MEDKKALVTGGGGFLGKAIVKKLINQGIQARSFSRQYYPELEDMHVEQIRGDIADIESVEKAVKGMDIVFHVAAKPGIWGSWQAYYQINVIGTQNVIDTCMKQGVSQLIYTSSPSVIFGDQDQEGIDETVPYPDNYLAHYPATKAMAEQKVIQASQKGLLTICIRPHLIWGPGDNHLFPKLLSRSGRLKIIGRKDDLVDTIYVDNAADAHILASEKLFENPSLSGNVYFVSQDEPVSKWEIINRFYEIAGLPPVKGHISGRTAVAAGAVFEFIYKLFGIQKDPPITRFAAKEIASSHWFDITKAKTQLGYQPKVSIDEGMEKLKIWYQSRKN